MAIEEGYENGDLVKHIYTSEIGILIKTRVVDTVYDPVAIYPIYDAYVLFSVTESRWVPLEHVRKISEDGTIY